MIFQGVYTDVHHSRTFGSPLKQSNFKMPVCESEKSESRFGILVQMKHLRIS